MREPPGVHALLAGEALFGETEYIAQLKALVSLPASWSHSLAIS